MLLSTRGGEVFGGVVEPEEWLLAWRNIPTCEGEECVVASLRSVGVCRMLLRSGYCEVSDWCEIEGHCG